jgi:catecholate siderophore receptor
MIFGRGGAGGLVNRVTKRPVFDSLREASVTLGSYNQFAGRSISRESEAKAPRGG